MAIDLNKLKEDAEKTDIGQMVQEHIAWTKSRISEGSILQAGKWGSSGGVLLIKADNYEQALEILKADPIVKSGRSMWELAPFFPDVPLETD